MGGASVLPATKIVVHRHGTALNPSNGVTYGFNMVGQKPSLEEPATITTDIIPVNVVVGGRTFSGSDVLGPTLASPVFADNNYSTTPAATSAAGGYVSGSLPLSSVEPWLTPTAPQYGCSGLMETGDPVDSGCSHRLLSQPGTGAPGGSPGASRRTAPAPAVAALRGAHPQ